jgi:hypothetical protein
MRVLGCAPDSYPDLGFRGAGDENRTRTISLGSSAVTAARGADQASLAVPSDRGWPLVTLVNGTLMARRSCAVLPHPGSPGPALVSTANETVRVLVYGGI